MLGDGIMGKLSVGGELEYHFIIMQIFYLVAACIGSAK
jgi:hypothetical protein